VFLSLPGDGVKQLAPPVRSGTFIIYGLCHELGHVAMYRLLEDRDWMTSAAAEGWAHYAGSVVVDHVFEAEGAKLWPQAYNYRLDGSARLRRQLSMARKSDTVRAAGQWQKLAGIIGEKAMPALFEAWQAAEIDATKPADALLDVLLKKHADRSGDLRLWWRDAEPLFVQKRAASDVAAQTVDAKRLAGKPATLALDDGGHEGRKSIAGGGHARAFEAPGEGAGQWFLTHVSFHGARYGRNRDASFEIALCDEQLRPIASWKQPYERVEIGRMQWWSFDIPPTRVPAKFIVCLRFDPTATHGVYLGYDNSTRGDSQVGVPGKPGKPFSDGDWMIRVKVDQLKEADALND
jgi:hypothetical protein